MNNQYIKDAIAALNEAIRILLQVDDLPPSVEREQLILGACGEMEEARDIFRGLNRLGRDPEKPR